MAITARKKRAVPAKRPLPKFVVVIAYKERGGWHVSGSPIAIGQSQAAAVKEAGDWLGRCSPDGRVAVVCEVVGVAKVVPSPAIFVPIDKI